MMIFLIGIHDQDATRRKRDKIKDDHITDTSVLAVHYKSRRSKTNDQSPNLMMEAVLQLRPLQLQAHHGIHL